MTFQTLMVNVHPGQSNSGVLHMAAYLAQRLHAAVIGVAACQPLKMLYGERFLSGAPFERDREKIERQMKSAEFEFTSTLQKSGAVLSWRSTMNFESPADWVAHEARGADLLIVSAASGEFVDALRRVQVGDLVMRTGRPCLLIPEGSEGLVLERAVVFWSDTRESMRAIADAIPLLKQADHVVVVEIAETQDLDSARSHLEGVALWLKAHAVIAETVALSPAEFDVGQLQAFARDYRADLIVAGAYGHSRLQEWAFGGVTRDLLLRSDCCTLLSH